MSDVAKPRRCRKQHPIAAATAYRCTECAAELSGVSAILKPPGLCVHLGEHQTSIDCNSCNGRISLKVYGCEVYGQAVLGRQIKGVRGHCDGCPQFKKREESPKDLRGESTGSNLKDTFSLISPIGTGKVIEGIGSKKPWQFRSTAIIPHLNTPESLSVVIELLKLQTEPPFIVVVDTGSPFKVCDQLEAMRSEDVEIHFIRANGYTHTSEPVTCALDVGFARASTPLIFLTHTDCYPVRRNALEWLGDQCSEETPVVGWEMSERSWLTDQWQGVVSHTFTMLHARTMRDIGATWHMARARDALGLNTVYQGDGWPDTETGFDLVLKAAGVPVKLLGTEVNFERQITEWWDHARSFTGTQVYVPETSQGLKTAGYTADAMVEAKERIKAWRRGH
jgi:DNA-directed RNA polymerase subunit RPC12/RpoP